MNSPSKVTSDHLRRQAYLYVRQSSLQQVHDHRESTARQYDLKRRAQALGWRPEQIIVVDEDLGLSGASAVERSGFQRLVAEVGLGRVGLVMGWRSLGSPETPPTGIGFWRSAPSPRR
jgi:DNA invertase Pin-like site-specific DNA recombinase